MSRMSELYSSIQCVAMFSIDDAGEHIVKIHKVPIDVKDNVEELFPSCECKHSYDCCGQWYPNSGKVIHEDEIHGFVLVRQDWIQNV